MEQLRPQLQRGARCTESRTGPGERGRAEGPARRLCRVKRNTSIGCIVYGSIDRSRSSDPAEWAGSVYDETALVQLDEIVRMLADRGVASPREAIRQILSL